MTGVTNVAGERVFECSSQVEACRWFLESGRRGDTLTDTGEDMADVVEQVLGVMFVGFDWSGCVRDA